MHNFLACCSEETSLISYSVTALCLRDEGALCRNHRNDSSSGGIGTFQPPPLTPPKAPWPDSARQKEDASQKRASTGTGGQMNGGSGAHVHVRPAEVASTSGGIEMVEGSYVTGAGGDRSANPFGFDSFGRQVAGAPQRQRPPLHHTGQQQRPPVSPAFSASEQPQEHAVIWMHGDYGTGCALCEHAAPVLPLIPSAVTET